MSERTPYAWTIDERIDAWERLSDISPPFSPEERALARAASEAWYFAMYLTETPARLEAEESGLCLLDWGIQKVNTRRRADQMSQPTTW